MMFGIGFMECIILVIVIILVVKPEDLPKLAYKVGRFYNQCRQIYYNVSNEIHAVIPTEYFDAESKTPSKSPLNVIKQLDKTFEKEG
jgi:sec-independent protein translocase protein TatB